MKFTRPGKPKGRKNMKITRALKRHMEENVQQWGKIEIAEECERDQ